MDWLLKRQEEKGHKQKNINDGKMDEEDSNNSSTPSSSNTSNGDGQHYQLDPSELYTAIKPTRNPYIHFANSQNNNNNINKEEISFIPQSEMLSVPLRNYQLQAASWMVSRERTRLFGGKNQIHPLWMEIKTKYVHYRSLNHYSIQYYDFPIPQPTEIISLYFSLIVAC